MLKKLNKIKCYGDKSTMKYTHTRFTGSEAISPHGKRRVKRLYFVGGMLVPLSPDAPH